MGSKEAVFQMRFAAKQLGRVIDDDMSVGKRNIIARSAFKDLLDVSAFGALMELIVFVAMHTNHKLREFRFKNKTILFTQAMVKKVLGVPSGDKPMDLLKTSVQSDLRDMFKNEKGRTSLAKAIEVLKFCDETDEETVIRSFGLIAFGTVLCPGTGNMVTCEFLGSMMDVHVIDQYAVDEYILAKIMKEVEIFQLKMKRRSELDASSIQWIGHCLPALAIIYMDHLSFPPLPPSEHSLNYGTPRVCIVRDANFALVVEIDKNKLSLSHAAFGMRPLLNIRHTVYVDAPAVGNVNAPQVGIQAKAAAKETEVIPSASLNEWLQKAMPSSQDLEVPPHLSAIYNKHKGLFAVEIDEACVTFGNVVKTIQGKRMASLLLDVHAARTTDASFTISCPMASGETSKFGASQNQPAKDTAVPVVIAPQQTREGPSDGVVSASQHMSPKETVGQVIPESVEDIGIVQPPVVASVSREEQGSASEHAPTIVDQPSYDAIPVVTDQLATIAGSPPRVESPTTTSLSPLPISSPNSPSRPVTMLQSPAPATSAESAGCASPAKTLMKIVAAGEPIAQDATTIFVAGDTWVDVTSGVDITSGPATHEKKQRYKRAAKRDVSPPKVNKLKVSAEGDALYDKFILHSRKPKHLKKNEHQVFITIGNSYCFYNNFQNSMRPRGWMDSEIMSLHNEKSNIENKLKVSNNKRLKKKFAFSHRITSDLTKDPSKFNSKDIMVEFKNVCDKYKLEKEDLEFNTFNSIKPRKTSSVATSMDKAISNLISNFALLTKEAGTINFDPTLFKHGGPSYYPQQPTIYDCGFFVILYMENRGGKVMTLFDPDAIPYYRRVIAASFINSAMNSEDSVDVLDAEFE